MITAHSLEPHRPWKAEQLGGGYRLSSWAEKTAYEGADAIISVSTGMKAGILESYPALDPAKVHVIRNGIDTEIYQPTERAFDAHRQGRRPECADRVVRRPDHPAEGRRPSDRRDPPLRSGRAARALRRRPGHPGDRRGDRRAIAELQAQRPGVFWFDGMLTLPEVKQVLSASTVFVCPSVYEPLGIVNLEAMACGAAVVASDVGGIPEVVNNGETGLLVHYDAERPRRVRAGHRRRRSTIWSGTRPGPSRTASAGRERAVTEFSWTAIAEQTVGLYRSVLG